MSSLPSSSLRRAYENRRSTPTRSTPIAKYRLPQCVRHTPRGPSKCWNCADDEAEWRLPTRRRFDGTFDGIGAFCSPECCKRYALDRLGSKGLECCALVSEIVRKIAGPKARCRVAPPFMCLDTFGGPLTREEYRQTFVCVTPAHVLLEYLNVVT